MTPSAARTFWKALMDNAAALVNDAHVLLRAGSFARARSLTVLAQEELGKALWLYGTFEDAWNTGEDGPLAVPKLKSHGTSHVAKYMEAFVFGQELAAFWGDFSSYGEPDADSKELVLAPYGGSSQAFIEPGPGTEEDCAKYFAEREREAKEAGRRANQEKMRGFYVDVASGTGEVLSPEDIQAGTIGEDLQTAAQVIEMLLIKDHSRMKLFAQTPYDSTHAQQHSLLHISHPEDWAAAPDWFKAGATLPPPPSDESSDE